VNKMMIVKNIVIFLIIILVTIPIYGENKCSITIDAKQDAVAVYVNGELYGIASGPSVIEDLDPGEYEIVVAKQGYISEKRIVELSAGDNITLNFDLVKKEEFSSIWEESRLTRRKEGKTIILSEISFISGGLSDYNFLLNTKLNNWFKLETAMLNPGYFLLKGKSVFYLLPSIYFKFFEFGLGGGILSNFKDFSIINLIRLGNKESYYFQFKIIVGTSNMVHLAGLIPATIRANNFLYMSLYMRAIFTPLFYMYIGNDSFGDGMIKEAERYTLYSEGAYGMLYMGFNFRVSNIRIDIKGAWNDYYGILSAKSANAKYLIDGVKFSTYTIFVLTQFVEYWENFEPFVGAGVEFNEIDTIFVGKAGIKINF